MADLIRSKEGALEKTRSRSSHMVEELDPSSGWTEDPNNYYLLIDLPHFKKEEIKIPAEGSSEVTISGERRVRDNRFVYSEKNCRVPENADTELWARVPE